jgi:PHD/YefM family antitoxin component YafN of YafNO toxin-antitoxin module
MASTLDITQETRPFTIFSEDSAAILQRLKQTQRPITLTVDGKPAAILQDTASYQRLLDISAIADEDEAIRQGLEDIAAGRTRPAREVFEEMRAEFGIPR